MKLLEEIEHCGMSCAVQPESIRQCQADARALWAVRVLDAWQALHPDNHAFATFLNAHGDWRCSSMSHWSGSNHATPDAARIAAAEALVAEDPSLDEE